MFDVFQRKRLKNQIYFQELETPGTLIFHEIWNNSSGGAHQAEYYIMDKNYTHYQKEPAKKGTLNGYFWYTLKKADIKNRLLQRSLQKRLLKLFVKLISKTPP